MKPNVKEEKTHGISAKKSSLPRLVKYIIGNYKLYIIIEVISVIITSLASVTASFFLQKIIDNCVTPGLKTGLPSVMPLLMKYVTIMAVIFSIGVIVTFISSRLMAIITQGTLYNLRKDMFSKMESLPIKYFDTHAHGDVMSTYTNDTDALRQFIGQSMPTVVQCSIGIIAMLVMMLYFSVWLSLVVFAVCFVMMKVTGTVGGASAKFMRIQQKSLAKEEGFVEEIMKGQKVVKVFCHEEESKKRFDELNEELFESGTKANAYGNILMPILGNMGNVLYVVLAIVGGLLVYFNAPNLSLSGTSAVSIGIIITFLGTARQLSQTIGQVAMHIPMMAMAGAGADRIFTLLDEEPEFDDGYVTLVCADKDQNGNITESDKYTGMWAWKHPHQADSSTTYTELKGDIRMFDVDFGYNPDKMVLHDISLYAKPGQKIAFVGATGAGKTTITNLINRFYDIEDGKIRYDGININKIRKSDLRRSLAIVLQDVNLFTGTVIDNIRYGKLDATDEECINAAKLANAHDFITRLPDGYKTMLTGNGASLSQGQRQLISIARAAVANAPAMILDEATSSIDTHTEALVQEGMDRLMHGRTVFVIAHRLSTVKNSDAIMVLDHGRVVEKGNHQQLIEQHGTYYQLYSGAFELE